MRETQKNTALRCIGPADRGTWVCAFCRALFFSTVFPAKYNNPCQILLLALNFRLIQLEDVKEVGVFLTGIFPLLFVPAAAGVMELWAEMGEMLLPIIIAIIPVTVLVMVTAGKTTQALTSRKKSKEAAANDGIAE